MDYRGASSLIQYFLVDALLQAKELSERKWYIGPEDIKWVGFELNNEKMKLICRHFR